MDILWIRYQCCAGGPMYNRVLNYVLQDSAADTISILTCQLLLTLCARLSFVLLGFLLVQRILPRVRYLQHYRHHILRRIL